MDAPLTFEWPDVPAPGEELIPDDPTPPITRASVSDAGTWVDGSRGVYAPVIMLDLAIEHGYQVAADDQGLVAWARDGYPTDEGRPDFPEFWDELLGEVEEWMSEHVAPDGYSFGWLDGDFILAHHVDWSTWAGESDLS